MQFNQFSHIFVIDKPKPLLIVVLIKSVLTFSTFSEMVDVHAPLIATQMANHAAFFDRTMLRFIQNLESGFSIKRGIDRLCLVFCITRKIVRNWLNATVYVRVIAICEQPLKY